MSKESPGQANNRDGQISLLGAISIGVGGMVGGGIFAVLGLAVVLAGGATWLSFIVAGVVAVLTAYSYAKLSVAYPSQGGTIVFIDKAFGVDLYTGAMNNLLWLGYVVTLALYAVAFGNYAATFLPQDQQSETALRLLVSLAILLPTLLNFFGAAIISKAETYIVAVKVAILILVIVLGFGSVDGTRLEPGTWQPMMQIVSAGMIIFVAYEGFELIANTAPVVRNYRTTLPRAYYISVVFVMVLYALIAVVVVGSLQASEIASAQDFALAEAAKPSLGQFGFTLVAIAAILATLSAINSTLYGAARLSYTIAADGELPTILEKKVWQQPIGLLITAGLALLLANLEDLSSISTMGSAGFLIIFAAVNLANFTKAKAVNSSRLIAGLGVVACLGALAALVWYTLTNAPSQIFVLVGMIAIAFVIEGAYRAFRSGKKRHLG